MITTNDPASFHSPTRPEREGRRLRGGWLALAVGCVLALSALRSAAQPAEPSAAAALAEGEIRKVDKAAGKVTLRHGPLTHLNMPAMTMVFRVRDPAWLEAMKPGQRIRFRAEQVNGAYTVVHYEPAD